MIIYYQYYDNIYTKFKSLYPSVLLEFNIAPNTQIGKIIIPQQVFDMENYYKEEKYERGGEYIENLVSNNFVEFCHRWLGLANVSELLEDWNEYNIRFKACYSRNGKYNRFYRNEENKVIEIPVYQVEKKENPLEFYHENTRAVSPIVILSSLNNKEVKYNGFIAGAH